MSTQEYDDKLIKCIHSLVASTKDLTLLSSSTLATTHQTFQHFFDDICSKFRTCYLSRSNWNVYLCGFSCLALVWCVILRLSHVQLFFKWFVCIQKLHDEMEPQCWCCFGLTTKNFLSTINLGMRIRSSSRPWLLTLQVYQTENGGQMNILTCCLFQCSRSLFSWLFLSLC
jgi:hypothetical protein